MMKYITTLVLGCIFAASMNAQVNNTIYFMDKVPQSMQLNPAIQPKCDFYFGLGSFHSVFGNSSISLNDILYYDNTIDSLIYFFRNQTTRNKFINNLKNINDFYMYNQIDAPASFGFRIKDLYFSFGASVKSFYNFTYPQDWARLMFTMNLDTSASYDLKDMGMSFTNFAEMSLGVSKCFNDQLTIGVRGKLLSGIFNMSTDNKRFTFYNTVDNSLPRNNISSDLSVNVSTAYFDIIRDSTGDFSDLEPKDDPYEYYKPFRSIGFGIDLGATYAIDKLLLSASLIDIGYIKWKNEERSFNLVGDTSFMGVGEIDVMNMGDSSTFNNLVDSFKNAFKFNDVSTTYTTWLPAKMYLAAEYSPVSFFSVGVLSLTQLYRKHLYQQFMFSGNLRFFRSSMFSLSYSVFENGFSNFGIGFSTRTAFPVIYFPPLQFYFVADNIPFRFSKSPYFVPYKLRNFNMRLGFNIVFGCGQQKKKIKDRPLIWE